MGRRLSVAEIQEFLRRMSIQSWLYLVARLDAHLVFNQVIDPGIEDQLIGSLFSPDLRNGIVAAWKRNGRRIPVFHRHQLLVFTRLLLATPGVPVGATAAEAKFEAWVGTAMLAVNDHLAADVEDDLTNDKLGSEARRSLLVDYTYRQQDLIGHEQLRYAFSRELAFLRDIPEAVDPGLFRALQPELVEAIGLPPEEFLALGFATAGPTLLDGHDDKSAPVLYMPIEKYVEQFVMPAGQKAAFIRGVSQCLEHAIENAAEPAVLSRQFLYDFKFLKNWPVITVAEGFSIVVSCRFLFRRITKDLFPYLHNRLRTRPGGPALAKQLEDLRGRSAERYVRILMDQVASKTRGVPVTIPKPFRYEAEDGSKVEGGDVLLLHGKGGILIVIEVKNGAIGRLQPHSGTAEDLFKPGTPLDKSLTTLARLVEDIGSGRCRVDRHDLARFTRIVPMVASREGYFQFPLFRPVLDREARVRGLEPDGAVTPVALLDFDEIELAPALEENGQSFANLLVQWVSRSATNSDSFTNFLWKRDPRLLDMATSEYRAKYLTDTDRIWKLLKGPDAPVGDNSAAIPE